MISSKVFAWWWTGRGCLLLFAFQGTLEKHIWWLKILFEHHKLQTHRLKLLYQQHLLHVQVLNELGWVLRWISWLLGVIFRRLKINLTSIVPVQNLDIIVLFEEVDEEGESQCEAIIVEEGFGSYFFVDLLFSSGHVLDIVDTEGGNDHIKLFEMFILFRGYFGAGFDHDVEIVDFVTELLLEWF